MPSAFNQDIGSWQVGALTDAPNMFQSVTLSIANYDALLKGWSTQTLKSSVTFSGGNSKYWDGTAARTIMTSVPNSWRITDGGKLYLVSVTVNQAAGQADPTRVSPINFTVQFNPTVTGFTSTDVTLSGTASPTTVVVTTRDHCKDPYSMPSITCRQWHGRLRHRHCLHSGWRCPDCGWQFQLCLHQHG